MERLEQRIQSEYGHHCKGYALAPNSPKNCLYLTAAQKEPQVGDLGFSSSDCEAVDLVF
jgi:hypothetical protein